MINVKIVQVGKTKDLYTKEAVVEFEKRLSGFVTLETITVKESKSSSPDKRIEEESAAVLEKLDKIKGYLMVLDKDGMQFDSVTFSQKLEALKQGTGTIIFVIGGPYGLSRELIDAADLKLSLSKMTFTHQMARIILLEQLYRACTISSGKQYHY